MLIKHYKIILFDLSIMICALAMNVMGEKIKGHVKVAKNQDDKITYVNAVDGELKILFFCGGSKICGIKIGENGIFEKSIRENVANIFADNLLNRTLFVGFTQMNEPMVKILFKLPRPASLRFVGQKQKDTKDSKPKLVKNIQKTDLYEENEIQIDFESKKAKINGVNAIIVDESEINVGNQQANNLLSQYFKEEKFIIFNGHVRTKQNENVEVDIDLYAKHLKITISTEKDGKFEMKLNETAEELLKNRDNNTKIFIVFTPKKQMKKIFIKILSSLTLKFGNEKFTYKRFYEMREEKFDKPHITFMDRVNENEFLIDFETNSVTINDEKTEIVSYDEILNNIPVMKTTSSENISKSAESASSEEKQKDVENIITESNKAAQLVPFKSEKSHEAVKEHKDYLIAKQQDSPSRIKNAWKKIQRKLQN